MEFIGLLGAETMFGHNSFTHPFEASNGWMQPAETFAATEIPMVSVKIDTTATNISPDWKVSHKLPGNTAWNHYGSSWTQYKTMPYVETNKGTHCFTVAESNDSAVPVGTTYGNCPDDSDNGDENGDNAGDAGLPEEEKGINWLLWGGAVVVVGVLFVM
jgi:hypothetical protein